MSSRKISKQKRKEYKTYGNYPEKTYGDKTAHFHEISRLHANLTEIMVLKAKKKKDELQTKCEQLLEKYTLSEVSKLTSIDISKVRRMLKSHLTEKTPCMFNWKLSDEVVKEISDFYRSPQISYNLPDMRFCTRKYMRMTIDEAYDIYKTGKNHHERIIARSTFGKLKPNDVVTIDKTPNRQCCCDTCENFRIVILAMKRHGFKGLGINSKKCIEDSLCELSKLKNSGNTSYQWTKMPKKSCSFRNCVKCGSIYEKKRLIKENTMLCTQRKQIQWKQWMSQTNAKKYNAEGFQLKINSKSSKKRSLYEVVLSGTIFDLLSYYITLLDDISRHHFNNCWQMFQFMLCQSNLQKNQIILIQDFARNFVIDFQDEPKTLHWAHDQVTVHPTVCCYPCPKKGCYHLVTLEIIHVSTDLKHDPHAVAVFKKDALNYIRTIGIHFDEVFEWTDQAPTQYKSRHVFISLSKNEIPTCHNYYPVKHGKNAADGASGRVKLAFKRGKLSREATIRNAKELFEYTANSINRVPTDDTNCEHFLTKVLFQGKIRRRNYPESEAIKDTAKIHSVRSTGVPNWVQIRFTTCCCLNCLSNSGRCHYKEFSDEWEFRCMIDDKAEAKDHNVKLKHWKHKISKNDFRRLENYSVQRLTEFEQRKVKIYQRFLRKEGNQVKSEVCNDKVLSTVHDTAVNLHKNVATKRKLVYSYSEPERKRKSPQPKLNKENKRKRKSFEKIEISDEEENKENVIVGDEDKADFWTDTYKSISVFGSFYDVLEYFRDHTFPDLIPQFHDVISASDMVHEISQDLYPADAPPGLVPISVIGDGNCLPRSLSLLTFGTEHRHKEIRMRIAREAFVNSGRYLDSEYLYKGSMNRSNNINIVEFYSLVSPVFNLMPRDEQFMNAVNFRKIYSKEALTMIEDRKWMGMWQLHQFANVVQRPLRIIYPMRNTGMRAEYNRYIYPVGYNPRIDIQDELCIMWTSTNNVTHVIDHFAPLLKQNDYSVKSILCIAIS